MLNKFGIRENRTGKIFKQINKTMARKLYNDGRTINLIPCKCGINGIWVNLCQVNNSEGQNFDSMLNSYYYYNCIPELGLYPHYFIE